MSQPTKQSEKDFFNLLRGGGSAAFQQPGRKAIETARATVGVPEKMAYYWLEKWCGKDWWDYGISIGGGWFTSKAPEKME
jgi:hypothetical protein